MAEYNGMKLTSAGRDLLARAHTGTVLEFVRAGAGDSTSDGESMGNERLSLGVQGMSLVGDGTCELKFVLTNTGLSEGFLLTEIGAFCKDPDDADGEILYAYTSALSDQADWIPPDGGSTIFEEVLDIYVVVANAQNVSVTLTPSNIYATLEDLQAHENADPAHWAIKIGFDNAAAGLDGNPARVQPAIEAIKALVDSNSDALAEHENADPAHPATKIGFDNSVAGLDGNPARVQPAIEAIKALVDSNSDALAEHENADPAHPATKIEFDNSVAGLDGDPNRVQSAIEALKVLTKPGTVRFVGEKKITSEFTWTSYVSTTISGLNYTFTPQWPGESYIFVVFQGSMWASFASNTEVNARATLMLLRNGVAISGYGTCGIYMQGVVPTGSESAEYIATPFSLCACFSSQASEVISVEGQKTTSTPVAAIEEGAHFLVFEVKNG